jgi:hypothetical protein
MRTERHLIFCHVWKKGVFFAKKIEPAKMSKTLSKCSSFYPNNIAIYQKCRKT